MFVMLLSLLFTLFLKTNVLYGMKKELDSISMVNAKLKELTLNSYQKKKKADHVIIVVTQINQKTSSLYNSLLQFHEHKKNISIVLFKSSIKHFKLPLSYKYNSLYNSSLIDQGEDLAKKIISIKEKKTQAIISIIAKKEGCVIVNIASQLLNLFNSFSERNAKRRKSLYLSEIPGFKRLSNNRKSDSFILKKLKSKIWLYEKYYYLKEKDPLLEDSFKKAFLDAKKKIFSCITRGFSISKYKAAKHYSTGFSMSCANEAGNENYFINTYFMLSPPDKISRLETKEYYLAHDSVIERCIHFWSKESNLFKLYFGNKELLKPSLFDLTSVKVKLKKPKLKQLFTKAFKEEKELEQYLARHIFTINRLIHQVPYYYPQATLKLPQNPLGEKPSIKIKLKSSK